MTSCPQDMLRTHDDTRGAQTHSAFRRIPDETGHMVKVRWRRQRTGHILSHEDMRTCSSTLCCRWRPRWRQRNTLLMTLLLCTLIIMTAAGKTLWPCSGWSRFFVTMLFFFKSYWRWLWLSVRCLVLDIREEEHTFLTSCRCSDSNLFCLGIVQVKIGRVYFLYPKFEYSRLVQMRLHISQTRKRKRERGRKPREKDRES